MIDWQTDYFHIYHDREFFAYEIDITRDDGERGEIGQRYTLSVSRSSVVPPPMSTYLMLCISSSGNPMPSLTYTGSRPSSSSEGGAASQATTDQVPARENGDRRWIFSSTSSESRRGLTGKIG